MVTKVCIVTNFRNTGNYGAVLQAYALNRKINSLGVQCETLDFKLNEQNGSKLARYIKRVKRGDMKGICQDLKRDAGKVVVSKKIRTRRSALENFKKLIPHTESYVYGELDTLPEKFDCFICGSDQVWRPTYQGNLVGIYWLKQIRGKAVKASYAASIGLDKLPASVCSEASEYLSEFDYISVREESARQFLSTICDKPIEVSVDPVFLLGKDEWKQMAVQPQVQEDYIFVYMIHGTKQLLKSIAAFAKMNNLKIVIFPYMSYFFKAKEMGFGDYRIFNATPNDFLGWIKHARYVFTDSFHATAFSVIFHKDFYVSSANKKAISRIINLMSICSIHDRIIPASGMEPDGYQRAVPIDWMDVESKMKTNIDQSLAYLYKVLNSK